MQLLLKIQIVLKTELHTKKFDYKLKKNKELGRNETLKEIMTTEWFLK